MSATRTLREYKRWTYDPSAEMFRHLYSGKAWATAAAVVLYTNDLTDDDHAPLMDLKKEPYEPMPTLESVIDDALTAISFYTCKEVANYGLDLCARIRAAFPHIDTPEGA